MVDHERPEGNGPFWIYPVPDMEAAEEGNEVPGFYIMMPVDERWGDLDATVTWYSARVVGTHEVHIKVPSLPFFQAQRPQIRTRSLLLLRVKSRRTS